MAPIQTIQIPTAQVAGLEGFMRKRAADAFKDGAAVEGEGLFHRVEHLHQRAAYAPIRRARQSGFHRFKIAHEVRKEYGAASAWQSP